MKCKNCGYDNMEGANFCIECGTRLEQKPDILETDWVEEEQAAPSDVDAHSAADADTEFSESWNEEAADPEDRITGTPFAEVEEDVLIVEEPVSEAQDLQNALDEYSAEDQTDSEESEATWYYMDGETPVGPFTVDEMLEKIHDGVIDRHTYVWSKGLPDWIRLSQAPFEQDTASWSGSGIAGMSNTSSFSTGQSDSPSASSFNSAQSVNPSAASFNSTQSVSSSTASFNTPSSGVYVNEPMGSSARQMVQEDPALEASKGAVEWFCVQDSRSTGPFSAEVIAQMLQRKSISGNTYVWKEGMPDWEYLRNTELASLLPGSAGTPYWNGAGPVNQQTVQASAADPSSMFGFVKPKNIAIYILLCLVTCGIWYYVWIYQAAKDINELASRQNKPKGCDPALAVILSLMTCGLYSIYYFYKEGTTLAQQDYPGYRVENQAVLLAVLGLFIPVASLAILQDQLNSIVRYGA